MTWAARRPPTIKLSARNVLTMNRPTEYRITYSPKMNPSLCGALPQPPEDSEPAQVEHQLIEHGRMNRPAGELPACDALPRENDAPRHRRGNPVRVAVHEVPEAAEGLSQDERRSHGIAQPPKRNLAASGIPQREKEPGDHAAVDRQTAVPEWPGFPRGFVRNRAN